MVKTAARTRRSRPNVRFKTSCLIPSAIRSIRESLDLKGRLVVISLERSEGAVLTSGSTRRVQSSYQRDQTPILIPPERIHYIFTLLLWSGPHRSDLDHQWAHCRLPPGAWEGPGARLLASLHSTSTT